jgi:glycosyltransferase involved in cell wall biosynthesis
MTIKNGESFVRRSIASVLYQTILPNEIVIVDDGSTDGTVSIITQIAKANALPIRLIRTEGIGRANALNLALEACNSVWIANLDVDDYWLPKKLEMQLMLTISQPEAQIVITRSHVVSANKLVDLHDQGAYDDKPVYQRLTKKDFYARNPVNHSSIMFSKRLILAVFGYNGKLDKQIDYDLWVRFLLYNEVFFQIDLPLTVKCLHKDQSFESKNILRYRVNSLYVKTKALKKLKAPRRFYLKLFLVFVVGFTPKTLKSFLR